MSLTTSYVKSFPISYIEVTQANLEEILALSNETYEITKLNSKDIAIVLRNKAIQQSFIADLNDYVVVDEENKITVRAKADLENNKIDLYADLQTYVTSLDPEA